MEENRNGNEVFPLDDVTIQMVAELREQQRVLPHVIAASIQTALQMFARQHRLKGNFKLADNGREIILHAPQQQGVEQ